MNINELTLEEKIGQMLMFAFHGTEYNDQIERIIHSMNLGGLAFFARNIKDINQVSELNKKIQQEAKVPLFIGLDQEGGSVIRIYNSITPLPGAMALASTDQLEIYKITNAVGNDLKNIGFNMNFAPVADINNNPLNPVINSRSYSDDPLIVSKCVINAYRGFQDSLILPTIKHFPGHGNTSIDSHLGLPIVNNKKEEVSKIELVPFINAINDGVDGIMISHIMYTDYDDKLPASLSYKIITKLLKEELGYKGLICTDSLTMGAIYSKYSIEEILLYGVNAGNDLLIFCGKADIDEQYLIYKTFIKLVYENKIPISKINESVMKILKLKDKYCKTMINLDNVGQANKINLAKKLQLNSITKVFDDGLLPIKPFEKALLIFPEIKISSLVDNEEIYYKNLNEYLKIEKIIINQDLKNLDLIKTNSKNYDKIIIATYNVQPNDYQQQVFDILDKDKIIVVSMRSPYDLNHLKGVKSYICIYEATKESLSSLALVLSGKSPFLGKLPIKLMR